MPEGKRAVIRKISRDTGISESAVYKILANPIGFSKATVDAVRQAAEGYGLLMGDAARPHSPAADALCIGVVLPARPLYFWREAVQGMERSRERLEAEQGIPIRLQFSYYNYPFEESECERILSFADRKRPDALILFPIAQDACRRFLDRNEETETLPVILFNDLLDFMTDDWFSAHPHVGSITPDGYSEGVSAAQLMRRCTPCVRRVAVVCSRHNGGARTSDDRIRGMCETLADECPEAVLHRVELDPTERMAPATLARALIGFYGDGQDLDGLYISSGVTHIACAAVEKLERRLGRTVATAVIGHECSAADKRYLLEGRQRGYIKQDVYTQGLEAVRDAVRCAVRGAVRDAVRDAQGESTPARRLYPSSVFIR